MKTLNTSNWKEFRIGDLFDISTGSLLRIKEVPFGDIPRISVKSDNNGILGYYDTENISEARHIENFVSVNFFGNAFYHPYKASLEMKVHCLRLKNKEFTERLGLYLVSALNKVFSQQNYSYGEQLSSSDLKNKELYIKIPATPSGEPDWDFMERYIAELEEEVILHQERLHRQLESSQPPNCECGGETSDTSRWKEFNMREYFDFHKGTKVTKFDRVPGDLPLISASNKNNGVTEYVGNDLPTYSNSISVNAFGQSFYHDGVCAGTDSVFFFVNDEISARSKLFVAAVISNALNGKFSFGKTFSKRDAENLAVFLPSTLFDEPDWAFMERYIAGLGAECIKEYKRQLYLLRNYSQ